MLTRTIIFASLSLLTACGSSSTPSDQAAAPAEQIQAQLDDPVPVNDPAQSDTPSLVGEPVEAVKPVQESVITTDSGLQYEVLRAAEGPKPSEDSVVTVDYVGTLTDGTEFDSSYSRGEPATFSLARVIAGWTEGVQLMSVGSKYRFVIPANLAYGDRGAGAIIKPGDTLVFEVDLLEINAI